MDDPQDVLRRVFAQLKVLSNNPPQMPDEDDVARYHELLDQLVAIGYRVEDFRFNLERDLHWSWTSHSSRTGRRAYAEKREVRPDLFTNKVDALLSYFELAGRVTPITFNAAKVR